MSSNGLKFIVEQSKSLEAKVFLQCGIFQEFFYADDEQTSFRINLTMLLECLNIFGNSATTTLRMSYAGYGSPLVLMLEDGGVLTDCSIRTMEPEEPLHIDIRSTEIPSNIIMKSQCAVSSTSFWDRFQASFSNILPPYTSRVTCSALCRGYSARC